MSNPVYGWNPKSKALMTRAMRMQVSPVVNPSRVIHMKRRRKIVRNRVLNKLREEVKMVDLSIPAATATIAAAAGTTQNQDLSTGYLVCNYCQTGDTNVNRDGNMVAMKSVSVRFDVSAGGNTDTSDGAVRYLIVLDKECNGSNSAMSTILSNTDEAGAATTTFHSGISIINTQRFQVLREGEVQVSKVGGPATVHIKEYIKFPTGIPVRYDGTANPMTPGHIVKNAVYFIAFGHMTGAGNLPRISNFLARFRFIDV